MGLRFEVARTRAIKSRGAQNNYRAAGGGLVVSEIKKMPAAFGMLRKHTTHKQTWRREANAASLLANANTNDTRAPAASAA